MTMDLNNIEKTKMSSNVVLRVKNEMFVENFNYVQRYKKELSNVPFLPAENMSLYDYLKKIPAENPKFFGLLNLKRNTPAQWKVIYDNLSLCGHRWVWTW